MELILNNNQMYGQFNLSKNLFAFFFEKVKLKYKY